MDEISEKSTMFPFHIFHSGSLHILSPNPLNYTIVSNVVTVNFQFTYFN